MNTHVLHFKQGRRHYDNARRAIIAGQKHDIFDFGNQLNLLDDQEKFLVFKKITFENFDDIELMICVFQSLKDGRKKDIVGLCLLCHLYGFDRLNIGKDFNTLEVLEYLKKREIDTLLEIMTSYPYFKENGVGTKKLEEVIVGWKTIGTIPIRVSDLYMKRFPVSNQ